MSDSDDKSLLELARDIDVRDRGYTREGRSRLVEVGLVRNFGQRIGKIDDAKSYYDNFDKIDWSRK